MSMNRGEDNLTYFDPLKFFSTGLDIEENNTPDPDFEKKMAIALQQEMKSVTSEMILTGNKKVKAELTSRLKVLHTIYQDMIKGDNISKIIQVVDKEVGVLTELTGMTEQQKANLLSNISDKLTTTDKENSK